MCEDLSLSDLLQAMSMLPQITLSLKNMTAQERGAFVSQLGLEGEEREAALTLIKAFQEGRQLTGEEQVLAQRMLEKALSMHDFDLSSILELGGKRQ